MNAHETQEGVMDSLMEALQSGAAFSRPDQRRKRQIRAAGGKSNLISTSDTNYISNQPYKTQSQISTHSFIQSQSNLSSSSSDTDKSFKSNQYSILMPKKKHKSLNDKYDKESCNLNEKKKSFKLHLSLFEGHNNQNSFKTPDENQEFLKQSLLDAAINAPKRNGPITRINLAKENYQDDPNNSMIGGKAITKTQKNYLGIAKKRVSKYLHSNNSKDEVIEKSEDLINHKQFRKLSLYKKTLIDEAAKASPRFIKRNNKKTYPIDVSLKEQKYRKNIKSTKNLNSSIEINSSMPELFLKNSPMKFDKFNESVSMSSDNLQLNKNIMNPNNLLRTKNFENITTPDINTNIINEKSIDTMSVQDNSSITKNVNEDLSNLIINRETSPDQLTPDIRKIKSKYKISPVTNKTSRSEKSLNLSPQHDNRRISMSDNWKFWHKNNSKKTEIVALKYCQFKISDNDLSTKNLRTP